MTTKTNRRSLQDLEARLINIKVEIGHAACKAAKAKDARGEQPTGQNERIAHEVLNALQDLKAILRG
jgi:hypothetical protein